MATIKTYYVDGTNGNASATGLSPNDALTTLTAALALANQGDTIHVISTQDNTDTYSENIDITQDALTLIGPGYRQALLQGATGSPALTISGQDITVRNMRVHNVTTATTDDAISITGSGAVVSDCYIGGCGGNGVEINGGDDCLIQRVTIEMNDAGVDGVKLASSAIRNTLKDLLIQRPGQDGIEVQSGDRCWFERCVVYGAGSNGFNIGDDEHIFIDCMDIGSATRWSITSAANKVILMNGIRSSDGYALPSSPHAFGAL